LCPSYSWLDDAWATLVQRASSDWYVYGLIVTDVDLLRATARWLEEQLGATLQVARLCEDETVLRAFGQFFELRAIAAKSSAGPHRFGQFEPSEDGEGQPRALPSGEGFPEDVMVRCLGFDVSDPALFLAARSQVKSALGVLLAAIVSLTTQRSGKSA
jgi:hypothetical protein